MAESKETEVLPQHSLLGCMTTAGAAKPTTHVCCWTHPIRGMCFHKAACHPAAWQLLLQKSLGALFSGCPPAHSSLPHGV